MLDWTALLALSLATATATDPIPSPVTGIPIQATTSATAVKVPDQAQIMDLPPDLRRLLQERVVALGGSEEQRMMRVLSLVFDDAGVGLSYDISKTLTVAEVWQQRKANCLSFALLVVAMAREAGLEAHVRELGEVVAFYQDAGIVYNVDHVNVSIRVGDKNRIIDMDRSIMMSRQRPRIIDDSRAVAHFHNNRGAELMGEGQLEQAEAALRAAVSLAPDFVPAWNNLGVLLQRQGQYDAAENALLAAYRLGSNLGPTLRNLANFYVRSDQPTQAQAYSQRLDQVSRNDPFHHFGLALACEHQGDHGCAIKHYRHAIRLQPGEHQFHFGLARAFAIAGDLPAARRELARAAQAAGGDGVRSLYERKLRDLHAMHSRSSTAPFQAR